jgi:hypothetical protein
LYCDRVIKNGNVLTKLAKLAPAPRATKIAGRAQHTSVDDEAKSAKKLAAFSLTACSGSMAKF